MSSQPRVAEYRSRMRAAGLRPIQLWVPDVRTEQFAERARIESALINAADAQDDIFDWLDEVGADWDEE